MSSSIHIQAHGIGNISALSDLCPWRFSVRQAEFHCPGRPFTFGKKRDLVTKRLREIGLGLDVTPTGAFYCFASLSELPEPLQDGMDFFRACLKEKVIVVPGAFFDVNPGKRRSHIPSRLRGYARISFGPSLPQVEMGLNRIEKIVRAC